MEGQLFYDVSPDGTSQTAFINLNRDLSIVNAKNYEHTSRDGHVRGFMCNIALVGSSSQQFTFITAPNTWKFRNAFRKFHAYRDLMFANAGVSKEERGRYGHTIRPYLNGAHYDAANGISSNKVLIPSSDNGVYAGGDWTHSKFATVPLYEQGVKMGDSALYVADEWPVTILDQNSVEITEDKTSGNYKTVGMIHSYNLDRQDVVTPTTEGETISGPENPLAALIASGNQAAGEILEITEEQELEEPPYDMLDGGDSVAGIRAQVLKVPTTLGIVRTNVFVPAGILELNMTGGNSDYDLYIDVIGEVLCKDLA
jgi:hypothetical protein